MWDEDLAITVIRHAYSDEGRRQEYHGEIGNLLHLSEG